VLFFALLGALCVAAWADSYLANFSNHRTVKKPVSSVVKRCVCLGSAPPASASPSPSPSGRAGLGLGLAVRCGEGRRCGGKRCGVEHTFHGINIYLFLKFSECSAVGSVSALGVEGHWFESSLSDCAGVGGYFNNIQI
jgi:hypothetical protein